MVIIPAIDLKRGRCVRLTEGREDSEKVYDRDPIAIIREYQNAGASLIHTVDLDGAFGAASENRKVIRKIIEATRVPIEVGGGIRGLSDIECLIQDFGARYVIVGTMAVEDPETLKEAVKQFGDSIVVGIDARGNNVAVRGWTKETAIDALALSKQAAEIGVRRIIYTDISRDGKLEGPNVEMTKQIAEASGIRVTASGGVSSLEDIDSLRAVESYGVDSVIVGKALYEGRFTLADAIDRVNQSSRADMDMER